MQTESFPSPLFILGSSRSGTELITQILNRHPNVFICPETHYFDDLRPRLATPSEKWGCTADRAKANKYFALLRAGAYGLNGTERPDDAIEYSGEDYSNPDLMFRAHCLDMARRTGKPTAALVIWGEKTPRHIFCISSILKAFPQAKFIFMLRDPRAVVASYRDWRNHFYKAGTTGELLRTALAAEETRVRSSFSLGIAALMWRRAATAAEHWRNKLGEDRFLVQRFEDLLAAPTIELKRICNFLGIAGQLEMLEVRRVNSSYGYASSSGIDPTAATSWHNRMSDAEMWIIEIFCTLPMEAAGYRLLAERTHPVALMVELARTSARIPLAFAVNWHRMGNPFLWIARRIGLAS
jgi:hypothetical protein